MFQALSLDCLRNSILESNFISKTIPALTTFEKEIFLFLLLHHSRRKRNLFKKNEEEANELLVDDVVDEDGALFGRNDDAGRLQDAHLGRVLGRRVEQRRRRRRRRVRRRKRRRVGRGGGGGGGGGGSRLPGRRRRRLARVLGQLLQHDRVDALLQARLEEEEEEEEEDEEEEDEEEMIKKRKGKPQRHRSSCFSWAVSILGPVVQSSCVDFLEFLIFLFEATLAHLLPNFESFFVFLVDH